MWPKLPQGNRLWLFAAACGHSRPSAAKLDFGHTRGTVNTSQRKFSRGSVALDSVCRIGKGRNVAEQFIVELDPDCAVAVLYWDAHKRRADLTLIDTSTHGGRMKLALHTVKPGGNSIMVWRLIDWQGGTVH